MARLTPAQLEQKLQAVLRAQPLRPAPRTLEARVLGEIARRQALPWWHQSFAFWPQPVKLAFLVLGVGLAALALLFSMHVLGVINTRAIQQVFEPLATAGHTLRLAVMSVSEMIGRLVPEVSPTVVYGGLALVGGAYAVMLGLGATAYRVLWSHR